jgi:predicted nucleic acid-binding protein
MPLTIVLDTSPLSTVTQRHGVAEADSCRTWVRECRETGCRIIAPAIAYYAVARELERAGRREGLRRLEEFCSIPGCYLPLSDTALRRAVRLWAQARNAGVPTADARELDCDVLIAAQALDLALADTEFVIATVNVGHLARFAPARQWFEINP